MKISTRQNSAANLLSAVHPEGHTDFTHQSSAVHLGFVPMNGTWHRAFMMSKKAIISFAYSHNVCFKMLAYGDNVYFGAL